MSFVKEKKCGCKGIRTCLLCEKRSGDSTETQRKEQVKYTYTYCPNCNLCWPDDYDTACRADFPLYLGKLKLFLDFLTEEQEAAAVSAIDEIQWMQSQSGRRKQDFGPKVNFKKKKVKIGEFKGFPKFTENILQEFENLPELSDFKPVELCHLEYSPERGSSIAPHVDDFWLWGERLVTVNLVSSTVLTLMPFSGDACECYQELNNTFSSLYAGDDEHNSRAILCDHKFHDISLVKDSFKSTPNANNWTPGRKNIKIDDDINSIKSKGDFRNSKLSAVSFENKMVTSLYPQDMNIDIGETNIKFPPEKNRLDVNNCQSRNENVTDNRDELSCGSNSEVLNVDEIKITTQDCSRINHKTAGEPKPQSTDRLLTSCDECTGKRINNMCSVFRENVSESAVAIRIVLPPRSLLVLAGCARYNWFHEIKRKDVLSRRLAMTFRELTAEFLDGGKESKLGKELLQTANNFCDFN